MTFCSKKHMRARIVLLIVCLSGIVTTQAQPDKSIFVKSRSVNLFGDSVQVKLDIELGEISIGNERQLILTPFLMSDGRNTTLPPVILNGKKRHKIYNRSVRFDKKNRLSPYQVVKVGDEPQIIHYSTKIGIEPWMKTASLALEVDLCGCGNDQQQISVEMIAQRFLPVDKPVFNFDHSAAVISFVEPPREEIKKRAESDRAYIIFETGKSAVLPGLFNNQEELNKITQNLDYLKKELSAQITHIRISAHASPEGSQISNRNLSWNRAGALTNWLRNTQNLKGIQVDSWGEGEDWVRLIELIRADTSLTGEDKNYLEQTIANVVDQDVRERQIMRYKGGQIYRYLHAYLYPKLRRCDYLIEFTVPEFTLEKSIELLKEKPSMLSLAEFYAIASTYPKGSRQFNDLFETAVRFFPEDIIAKLNVAAVELSAGKLDEAGQKLNALKDDSRAWNNIGVLLMKQHLVDEAEQYLKRAANAGHADAEKNLQLIPILRRELERYNKSVKDYQFFLEQ